jgi:hypothetical protein
MILLLSLVAVVVVGFAVAIVVQRSGGGKSAGPKVVSSSTTSTSVPKGSPSSGVAASVNLSKSDEYSSISDVGGKLVLFGPKGYPSMAMTCNAAALNPSTLALGDRVSGSCADPATEGQRVLPVFTVERGVAWSKPGGASTVTVEVSHAAPLTPALHLGPMVMAGLPDYRVGPVVMRFPDQSGSWPVWAYGDGYMWLYGSTTTKGSELLRISESTGAVAAHVHMPDLPGPILVVDKDGIWMAPPANSHGSAVFHVGVRGSVAIPVFHLASGEYAAWMLAAGHSVWFAASSSGKGWALWQLVGSAAQRRSHGTIASLDNEVEIPGGASTMVGDGSGGLWTAVSNASGTEQIVIQVDPTSGAFNTIASITPGYARPADLLRGAWQALTLDGSMYLLDPPATSPKSPKTPDGFSAVYRINLRTGAVTQSTVPVSVPATKAPATKASTTTTKVATTT